MSGKKKLNGHAYEKVSLKDGATIAQLFDRFSSSTTKILYTRSGDTAVNADGEDKSTGITHLRYEILSVLCENRKAMTVAEVQDEIPVDASYSSVRSSMLEMCVQGLTSLAVPPQPVVKGRHRPYRATKVGRAVVRNAE